MWFSRPRKTYDNRLHNAVLNVSFGHKADPYEALSREQLTKAVERKSYNAVLCAKVDKLIYLNTCTTQCCPISGTIHSKETLMARLVSGSPHRPAAGNPVGTAESLNKPVIWWILAWCDLPGGI
jgi:hypothetical protein